MPTLCDYSVTTVKGGCLSRVFCETALNPTAPCVAQILPRKEGLLHRAFAGDLKSKWCEAHMKELLAEMEEQSKLMNPTRTRA